MINLNEYKDYFVYIEQRNGELMDVSLELVSEATKMKKRVDGYKVVGVLLGYNVGHLVDELYAYGCDSVIVVDDKLLQYFIPETYTKALSKVVLEYKPDGLLIGATTIGRDLGPRVAARCKTGLTADATIIEVDPENEGDKLLWITRPAFGGNLFGTIICPNHRPQMATIRPGVLSLNIPDQNRIGELINFDANLVATDVNINIIEIVQRVSESVDITKAEVIISGGRGIGGVEGVKFLDNIASEINAVVASSRAVVDAGWISKSKQVGQTGKTVKPKIYIACGISGAVQHTAGMDKSEYIIAINKDKYAPIFDVAHLGIVGDLFEVLPKLVEELKNRS